MEEAASKGETCLSWRCGHGQYAMVSTPMPCHLERRKISRLTPGFNLTGFLKGIGLRHQDMSQESEVAAQLEWFVFCRGHCRCS